MHLFEQFLLIATVHFFAVASPGPDFALILKQSVTYNRKVAIFSSLGIATGIIVHVTYSIVGIGLLIASDARLLWLLKYIAAAYFCYVGWHCLRAKKTLVTEKSRIPLQQLTPLESKQIELDKAKSVNQTASMSVKKAFLNGFLINALNVKATLFFVSLFSVVIAPNTLLVIKLTYGAYLVLATAIWFCFLSCVLTQDRVRKILQRKSYLVDRVMGIVLLFLAMQLLFF